MAKNKELSVEEQKREALKLTLAKLDKAYGKGTVRALGDSPVEDVEVYSTGSIGLDAALGVGGYPKGRVIEIYAQRLGVDVKNLLVTQPDSGEQALEIADALIRSGAVDLIVIDSVAALTPKGEIEGDMGDSKMGLHARLMSQALRKITASISKANCIVIFINQLRDKIGVSFGSPETTTGGNALKFYSSVRLDIRKAGGPQGSAAIKDGNGEIIGNRTKVKVVKNKVASPFKATEFDIIFGLGISKIGEILDIGVDADIITKSGSWFSYKESKLGQGRDAVIKVLKDNPELTEALEAAIREWLKSNELPSKGKKKGKKAVSKKAKEEDLDDEVEDEDFDDDEELFEDEE